MPMMVFMRLLSSGDARLSPDPLDARPAIMRADNGRRSIGMAQRIGETARALALPLAKKAAGLVTRAIPIPRPTLLVGPGSSVRLAEAIAGFGHRRVFVVADPVLARLGLVDPFLASLEASGCRHERFDEVTPDAPIPIVERGIEAFRAARCDAIVAFGGGSVMDAAKVIGLAAANRRDPRTLVGYFRAFAGPAPIYAVPTTAGTGSEVTVAAVISDPEAGRKLVIADTRIVPQIAALDPELMAGLPRAVTAATGMDALTHAIEAYISGWRTDESDRLAETAVRAIFQNLPIACRSGRDLVARERMALAATWAGMAFTRANVGNVHAIAHQLGGRYHTPHGLANAIVLPHVLRFCVAEAAPRLAALARALGLGKARDAEPALARRFIAEVEALARGIGIPERLDALRASDIPALAEAACWEADTNYPVPRRMDEADCAAILRKLLPEVSAKPPSSGRKKAARTSAAARKANTSTARGRSPRATD
jgi:alcohol dehydrogenase class IV